jgi:hypothetical protein
MLDEIRSFFEELRKPFKWPENLSTIDPAIEHKLRTESELHWRLAMQSLDDLETKIVELYEAGADVPAAIDLIDEVMVIIRRKDKPQELRVREIGQLMQERGGQIARS